MRHIHTGQGCRVGGSQETREGGKETGGLSADRRDEGLCLSHCHSSWAAELVCARGALCWSQSDLDHSGWPEALF